MRAAATRGIERQFEQLNGLDLFRLPPGLHADGYGLYLEVRPSGARTWVLETEVEGQEQSLDLGPLTASPLSIIRREAAAVRARANRGEPLQVRARDAAGFRERPPARPPDGVLSYAVVPDLVRDLRRTGASLPARLATEFLILTAARTVEILEARWDAIDRVDALWRVPSSGRSVPLSAEALELLSLARHFRSSELVFPSPKKPDRPLSNMAILMLLRRMGQERVRPLGFRRAFRAWARAQSSMSEEVVAGALGYRRRGAQVRVSADQRSLLSDWGAFVTGRNP